MLTLQVLKKSSTQRQFDAEAAGLNRKQLSLFFNMIYERQMIWKRRFIDKLPAPWTTDEVFSKYKFCNVYREHDRSSQWEIRNIIMDPNLTGKNLLWKILVYRTFNNPETFVRALDKWPNGIPDVDKYDENEFASHIGYIASMGLNPFTNAYSITGRVSDGHSINYSFCHVVLPAIHNSLDAIMSVLTQASTPEQIATFLMTLPSVSNFIAHEYYQDLTYIPIYTDKDGFMSFGQNDFTNLGPGSSQGSRLLFPKLKKVEQLLGYYYLQDIADEKLEEIGLEKGELMPYIQWNKELKRYDVVNTCNFSLNQIEGALCEFSKYVRILKKTGNPRCPEFKPKTDSIIVQRENDDQREFITDLSALKGKRYLENTEAERKGRPRKKDIAAYDFSANLTLNLNLLNAEQIIKNMLNL